MNPKEQARQALLELGMTTPEDIDVDAIAMHYGALTQYANLSGCEGRIIGCGESAIITVNKNSSLERQRFTVAHEVGHWLYDRGITSPCSTETIARNWGRDRTTSPRETRANRFASELLLPDEMIPKGDVSTWDEICSIAAVFKTSLMATSIRITEKSSIPLLLICMERERRIWYIRSTMTPDSIWPIEKLHPHSRAARVSVGNARGVSDADVWFTLRDAHKYEIHEDTVSIMQGMTLTIISWPCADMITSLED